MTGMVLDEFFAYDYPMDSIGVDLELAPDNTAVKIFCKLGMLFSDIPAFQEMLACKGHSALMPCALCRLVTQYQAPLPNIKPLWQYSTDIVSIAEMDREKWKMHTNKTLRKMLQKLGRMQPMMSTDDFAEE